MKPNVGSTESKLRLLGGITAAGLAVGVIRRPWLAALLGAAAASGIETGLSRYCPLNEALGIDNAPELTQSPLSRHPRPRALTA